MQTCIYINIHIRSLRNTEFVLQLLATKCSVFQLKQWSTLKLSVIVIKFGNIKCNVLTQFLQLTSTDFSGV